MNDLLQKGADGDAVDVHMTDTPDTVGGQGCFQAGAFEAGRKC